MTSLDSILGRIMESLFDGPTLTIPERSEVKHNLQTAYFKLFPFGTYIPENKRGPLKEIAYLRDLKAPAGIVIPTNDEPLEQVFSETIKEETGLDIPPSRIHWYEGSMRDAISEALTIATANSSKPIALPLPNWHFWDMGGRDHPFLCFDGTDEDELVENFKRAAPDVSAVLLAYPAVSLAFTPSRDAVLELDRIAQRHGVTIVVDDVKRGCRQQGMRSTIAEHIADPIIVETFSRRYGRGMFDDVAYITAPRRDLTIPQPEMSEELHIPQREASALYAKILRLAKQYAAEPALAELALRNQSFDDGLRTHGPRIESFRPDATYLTTLITIPDDVPASDLAVLCASVKAGVAYTNHIHYYPAEYPVPDKMKRKIRIAVGPERAEALYDAGMILGKVLTNTDPTYWVPYEKEATSAMPDGKNPYATRQENVSVLSRTGN